MTSSKIGKMAFSVKKLLITGPWLSWALILVPPWPRPKSAPHAPCCRTMMRPSSVRSMAASECAKTRRKRATETRERGTCRNTSGPCTLAPRAAAGHARLGDPAQGHAGDQHNQSAHWHARRARGKRRWQRKAAAQLPSPFLAATFNVLQQLEPLADGSFAWTTEAVDVRLLPLSDAAAAPAIGQTRAAMRRDRAPIRSTACSWQPQILPVTFGTPASGRK